MTLELILELDNSSPQKRRARGAELLVAPLTAAQTNWTQLGADLIGEAAGDGFGRSVSLSADGNHFAVGASGNDGAASNSGHVRVYVKSADGASWVQIGDDIDGEAAGDQSGTSVSISADGNRVAVGARSNDGAGSDAGKTRVYEFSTGAWTKLGDDIDGEAAGDQFGASVSLSADGNRVAIGAVYTTTAQATSRARRGCTNSPPARGRSSAVTSTARQRATLSLTDQGVRARRRRGE